MYYYNPAYPNKLLVYFLANGIEIQDVSVYKRTMSCLWRRQGSKMIIFCGHLEF